jgi:hypothetical protein
MAFRPANNLILARFRWSRECCIDRSTGQYLGFPIHIGDILIIEEITGGCAKFHDDKIMDNCTVV